jgi:gluconolactonase
LFVANQEEGWTKAENLMKRVSLFLLCVGMQWALAIAQTPAPGTIKKLDPALDAIVRPNAKVEVLKDDYFGIAEGPVWIKDGQSGYLIFSDIGSNNIYKRTPDGKLSVFLEKTGWSGTDTSTLVGYISGFNGRIYTVAFGSNGIALDPQGRFVWVAQGDRSLVRQEKDGKRTVLADHYEGKRLNRPNDLAIKSDGAIYVTDPRGNRTAELDYSAVWLVKDGKVQLLEKDYSPNGIAFSPDEKYLYVNGQQKIYRYEVRTDDTLANRQLFVDMSTDKSPGGADGMKVDQKGNLYSAGPGGIWVISPEGKHLGTIIAPEGGGVTNMAFGDADGKTLYMTVRRTLARIRLNVAGAR